MTEEEASPPVTGDKSPAPARTDPELFHDLRAATIFRFIDAGSSQRWREHLTRLLDELFASQSAWEEVVLHRLCEFLAADIALMSEPVDTELMRICQVWGDQAAGLLGQQFDRRRSIAGRVHASGLTAFVGSPRLRSPLKAVELYGPMVIVPLRLQRGLFTISVARLHTRDALTAADMELAFGFAAAAGTAVDAVALRARYPDAQQELTADNLLRSLAAQRG